MLGEVDRTHILQGKDALTQPKEDGSLRNPATVNRYIASLSHVFTVAIEEWGWIEHNPCERVKKLKESRGRDRYLNDEERERLLKACKEDHNEYLYPAVVLAIATGARRSELLDLQTRDVDLQTGRITFRDTKNGETRSVYLRGESFEVLKELSRDRIGRLFGNESTIRKGFERVREIAQLKDFRWHDLRHTTASYLAMNGATITEIAAVLGHKTLAVTKRYSHLSEGHVADVLEKMNKKVLG